ncbi:MAG: RNA-binding protein [Alphaproteobacteria bacterium]|nr:MAG: RNA-binding protein [Alphaproteobacteria bacterium]
MSVYIGNIAYTATYADLEALFGQYGAVAKVTIPQDHERNRIKGYAFIEFEDSADEDKAIEALNKAQHMGRSLKVEKAIDKSAKVFG